MCAIHSDLSILSDIFFFEDSFFQTLIEVINDAPQIQVVPLGVFESDFEAQGQIRILAEAESREQRDFLEHHLDRIRDGMRAAVISHHPFEDGAEVGLGLSHVAGTADRSEVELVGAEETAVISGVALLGILFSRVARAAPDTSDTTHAAQQTHRRTETGIDLIERVVQNEIGAGLEVIELFQGYWSCFDFGFLLFHGKSFCSYLIVKPMESWQAFAIAIATGKLGLVVVPSRKFRITLLS